MTDSLLRLIPPSAAIISPDRHLTAAEIPHAPHAARASTVALMGDAVFLFEWLARLDGAVARLAIVPKNATQALLEAVNSLAGVEWIVDDEPAVKTLIPQARFWREELSGASGADTNRDAIKTEWVLATSGTTSTPKLVAHDLGSLTRLTKLDPRLAGFRWGLMYDPARFAGMQVLLQAMLNGSTLLVPRPHDDLAAQLSWLAEAGCNAISATPTLWRKMLMSPAVAKLQLSQITLGGEIADDTIIRALVARFPAAKVQHIYASTEAGVGFSVRDSKAGFPAEWLERTDLPVRLKMSENGSLLIANAVFKQHYLNSESDLIGDGGWIDTGDVVEVVNGRVYFQGRENGSINVGGNKAFPEEIETIIRQVDGVDLALVRGIRNSVVGNLVEALVVPSQGAPQDLAARVKAHCRQHLDSYKVPAFVRLVESIEVTGAGKMARTQQR